MKCGSCGAIGSSASNECDFCGNTLRATQSPGSGSPIGGSAGSGGELNADSFIGYVKDSLAMVQDLNKSPSKGFSWWAFFFPVPFLWGYGANDNAKSVATVVLVPAIALWVISRLFGNVDILNLALFAWVVYVSFMVATRVEVLVKQDKPFDVGGAIVAGLVYFVALGLFS